MQTHLISASPAKTQEAGAPDRPNSLVLIIGQHEGEMDEPVNFIREASRIIQTGRAAERSHSDTAAQALVLLQAACASAMRTGRWSPPGHDPIPDLVELSELATARLGPVRKNGHVVTDFRSAVAALIRLLGAPA